MKKNLYYLIIVSVFAVFFARPVFSQVTIGSLEEPDKSAILDIISPSDNYLGVLLPRMGTIDRDNIEDPANGLLIFNTDENCINAYDVSNSQWNSLCGGFPNVTATIDCVSATVNGTFIQGTPTYGSNYMTVPVYVTKPGMYIITAAPFPANGYFFTASGSFPSPGNYVINLPANGTPTNANPAGDPIKLVFNGDEVNCGSLVVPVSLSTPDYTITNVTVVPPMYPVNIPLTPDIYYLIVTLNVKVPGPWTLISNTINGYSFGATGNLAYASGYNPSGTFPQTVTVTVPVAGGQANIYNPPGDNFTLSNLNSVTPSAYPFNVPLAAVGFSVYCNTITVTGDPFIQNQPLTNQQIKVPIQVTAPGNTTIKAIGAGMSFTSNTGSGDIFIPAGNSDVYLYPETTSGPITSGSRQLVLSSTEGGLFTPCNVTVDIEASTAIFNSLSLYRITPSAANYIIDVKGNIPPVVELSAVVSQAGEYDINTAVINGVKFSGNGTLIASATPQIITLYASGTPIGVTGKETYTATYDSHSVNFDIYFVYRAMRIGAQSNYNGSSASYNLSNIGDSIRTTAANGRANFGQNGTIPTAGITFEPLTTIGTGTLATFLNSNNYDIFITQYNNNTWNANDVNAAINFVNNGGVLFVSAQPTSSLTGSNSVRHVMASLFGTSLIPYGGSSNFPRFEAGNAFSGTGGCIYQANGIDDPVLNGPFGDIRNRYLGEDYNNGATLVGSIPTAIELARGANSGGNPTVFVLRHPTKGFFWAGDGGFFSPGDTRYLNQTGGTTNINKYRPTQPQGYTGTNEGVYNGTFLFNFFAFAIKFIGTTP